VGKKTAKHNAVNKAAELEGFSVSQAAFIQSHRASAIILLLLPPEGQLSLKKIRDKREVRPV